MAISWSQTTSLTCPQCGIAFEAEVWLIVDIVERPDLLERIRNETLHDLICPDCNQTVAQVDASLLLYHSGETPPLLFSPVQATTTEQDHEQVIRLVSILRERLGNAWQNTWLEQGLRIVPRPLLSTILNSGLEAPLDHMEKIAQQSVQLFMQQLEAVAEFFQARNWADLYLQVNAHPELLRGDANDAVEALIGDVRSKTNSDAIAVLEQRRDLLYCCREIGIEPAFAEKMGTVSEKLPEELAANKALTELPAEVREVLAKLTTFITLTKLGIPEEMLDELIKTGITIKSPEDLERLLAEHPDMREKVEAVRREASFDVPPEFQSDLRQAVEAERRYYLNSDLTELEVALAAWVRILRHRHFMLTPESFQLAALNNAGTAFQRSYEATGHLDDLNQASVLINEAVQRTPADSPDLPIRLNNLGKSLLLHFERTGQLEDLEQAIRVFQQSVKRMPTHSPDLIVCLTNLGSVLLRRYEQTGQLEDLEQAIGAYQQAVQRASANSPDLPNCLNNLSEGLRSRYNRTGQLEDLEQAIAICRKAVQLTPANSPDLPLYLTNLGIGLLTQYELTGELTDLEQSIRYCREAAQLSPLGSPELHRHLTNLGKVLFARFVRTRRLEDLEQAIEICREVIRLLPNDSPSLSLYLTNLGTLLHSRYELTKQPEDLEQAIKVHEQAVQCSPANSPYLSGILSNLGNSLQSYYDKHTGRLKDLDQAIGVYQEALQLTPGDSPDQPNRLNNLGNSLLTRYYEHTEHLKDLEQAIRNFQEALQLTPSDSPSLPNRLNNLSNGLLIRYERTGQQDDLRKAIAFYEDACQIGLHLDPYATLTSANSWGNWATRRNDWAEAALAYAYGVQAIEQLYRAQLLRTSQETWLSEARDLHIRAAYALAHTGQLREAATILEMGRARSLSEVLARDHADLERVRSEDPKSYESYLKAAERLRQLERAEREGSLLIVGDQTAIAAQSPTEQINQARDELEQAITRIRRLPGYEDFLAKLTYHNITQAVQPHVPLIYLITTSTGSLALLVHSDSETPEVIWAKNFTEKNLNALLIKRQDKMVIGGYLPGQLLNSEWLSKALVEALSLLGRELFGPIANRLRELKAQGVVLIPTGLLGLLPLHATHYQTNDKETSLLDEFDVAYAPSARVLAAVKREAEVRQNRVSQLVGVGNPLPSVEVGAWAQGELQRVIPVLQRVVDACLSKFQASTQISSSTSSKEYNQIQRLIPLWKQILQHLHTLCYEVPEQLIRAGRSFQLALSLFLQFKNVFTDLDPSDDIAVTLASLTRRIPPSLTYAHAELESVLRLLPEDVGTGFYEQKATLDALWSALLESTIAHLACHGRFDPESPLDSTLLLARESQLTLRDLLNAGPQHLAHLRLVVLSACQTAIIDFLSVPDESVGLLSGFLQTGVPSVIGTLWSVNDQSTALLVMRFYELYLHGDPQIGLLAQSPARALRLAQCWLRDLTYNDLAAYLRDRDAMHRLSSKLTLEHLPLVRKAVREGKGGERPYGDPYFWAAFVYYGVL